MVDKDLGISGKYEIVIQISDSNVDEVVDSVVIYNTHSIEKILYDIPELIRSYEEDNYIRCHQCREIQHIKLMSEPENEEYKGMLFCPDCLDGIFGGFKQIKLSDSELEEVID